MWIAYTIYKNSNLATAMSIVGMIMLLVGITMATQEIVAAGIIVALIGGALAVGARFIANAKKKKDISALANHELDERIKSDINYCVDFYNKYPSQKIAAYLTALNPASAELIYKKQNPKDKNNKKKVQVESPENIRPAETAVPPVVSSNSDLGSQSLQKDLQENDNDKPTVSQEDIQPNEQPHTFCRIKCDYLNIERPIDKVINIGRDSSCCDIIFPADTAGVSRKHCAVMVSPQGTVFVMDLGSSNGTFLPGVGKITPNEWIPVSESFYIATEKYSFAIQYN